MKKFKSDLVVGSLLTVGFMWFGTNEILNKNISEKPIDENENMEYISIKEVKENHIKLSNNDFYHEFKKEEEKQRLIALHNERLEQLEIERKTEEERLRKLEEARKLREKEKREVVISRGKKLQSESNWMTFEATYYTPYCTGCSGKTAVGINARESIMYNGYRIIATDPKVIPMWSLVEVVTPHESFKAIAGDTGGAIKGKRTDILVSTKKEAFSKGRHDVKIRVIKYGGKK